MGSNNLVEETKLYAIKNSKKWYVAYTAPRAEKQVGFRLEKAGIEYFLPLRKEFRQWSDRIKQVVVPAFPSYIFVHVNPQEYFSAINQTGMVKYVSFGGVSAEISEKNIENIRKMLDYCSIIELCDKLPDIGERYKIPSGPLKGFDGKVIRLKGKDHFVVEIEEWGKCIIMPYMPSIS